jgi:hypothetical protein
MEVLTLATDCHEGLPPADDIFAHSGCPQPVPAGYREQAPLGCDVTYQEDKSLVRTGNAHRVMATLRSLAISLLRPDGHANVAVANRHHARDRSAR